MTTEKWRRIAVMAVGATLALGTTGCLSSSDGDGGSGAASGDAGDGTVTILGAFGGAEQDALEASLADFEEESGIDIQYTSDTDFATSIVAKVGAGDAPDIAFFPQPGGLLDLSDDITPLEDVIDLGAIEDTLIPGFLEAATKDGTVYGAPMRMAVKSIVWYPKSFEDTSFSTEPATFQELVSESEDILASGVTPWCMGWQNDQATGWVGTDWLEEMVLRTAGPEVYDQWVAHEIPFNDPQIATALDEFAKIAKSDLVLGGAKGVLNTTFDAAMNPAFEADPGCYLHRQGNFATGFYPEDVQADLDGTVGTFYFPPFEGGYDGSPVLGGGDLAAAFNGEDEDTQAVMEFITSDQFGAEWAAGRRVAVAALHVRREQLRRRDHPRDRPVRGRRRRVPLRRLGPDAGRGRVRLVLDRDGQVGERSVHPGHPRRHRGVLADVMSIDIKGPTTGTPVVGPDPSREEPRRGGADVKLIIGGIVGMAVTAYVMWTIFLSFGIFPEIYLDNKIIVGVVAITVGVGGAAILFRFLNMFVEGLPSGASQRTMPYAYLLPGFGLIGLVLLYPAVQTIVFSFANDDSTAWVGFSNYTEIFGREEFRTTLVNNLLWLIIVPAAVVSIGIVVAVLADKLGQRSESVSKSLIFLPMAISFVGASAIWKLVYNYDNPGAGQTGILNAVWTTLGGDPQTWLQIDTAKLNSLLLMVIVIWLQVGFAMILLSSAIKGVPEDTLEAARIDGASEWQIFWRVVIPQIKGTTITVFITVLIMVMKIFDIVYVLTNGAFNTNVIANAFYFEQFKRQNTGTASAIVVVLLVAIIPVLIYQVRHFRREEANA